MLEHLGEAEIVDLSAFFAREKADRRAALTVIEGGAA
jgi:hypothetical protein